MNIAFDATAVLGPMGKNRGIGNYAISQFKKMLEMDKENQYYCLNLFDESIFGDDTDKYRNLKEYIFYCGKDRFLSMHIDYKNIYGDLIKQFIKINEIDIFYITSPFEGHIFPYQKEWFGNIKVIATVYDIIPYVMKDIYLSDKNMYNWYMNCIDGVKYADKFLVISGSVKEDLIKYFNFDKNKIDVMYGAVNDIYKKINVNNDEKESLFNKFKIRNEFILCTGGDDDRKNIKGLIEAYSKINKELIDRYQLVVVCKLGQTSVQFYSNIISNLNLQDRVILTNFVTNEELLYFYNLASLLAFPSKYEGFGLPVVEAFACGTPVLTSNNSSLGEIAKGAAVLVDPFNIDDISRGLEIALTKTDNEKHIQNGYEKLKLFQWDNVAEVALNTINGLKNERSNFETKKHKIAFFTPLPPVESGISDYSVDILNSLSNYFEIDVFIDDNYEPICKINKNIQIFIHKQFNKKCSFYENIIYQVGNSQYHIYMFPYIQKYKGIIVLHDYNLHSVLYHFTMWENNRNDIKKYKNYILEDFNEDITNKYINELKIKQNVPNIYDIEINGFVSNYADKIIVHSNEAKEKLLKKNIKYNVKVIRSYVKLESLIDNNEIRNKYGYSRNDIIIASFGHIHNTKRALPTLKAFKLLSEKYQNVSYTFAGKLDVNIIEPFNNYLLQNNLNNKVKITGYIDLNEFKNYIDLTDICLNLRYPYNGETSASLMRILAKGKCVIVNDIGSFSEIPDNCCLKIPNAAGLTEQQEINNIYDAMEKLLTNQNLREDLSKSARKYAEENLDINIIARQYYNCIIDKHKHSLDEKAIKNIIDYELPKGYSTEDIKALSRTLGFCIT